MWQWQSLSSFHTEHQLWMKFFAVRYWVWMFIPFFSVSNKIECGCLSTDQKKLWAAHQHSVHNMCRAERNKKHYVHFHVLFFFTRFLWTLMMTIHSIFKIETIKWLFLGVCVSVCCVRAYVLLLYFGTPCTHHSNEKKTVSHIFV